MTKYRTIVADPPWPYDAVDGGKLRASRDHRPNSFDSPLNGVGIRSRYAPLSIADLCALPIAEQCDESAHLYLWVTNAFMYEAHDVARAWGFKVKTICTWGKIQPNGEPSMKVGYWFRGATEHWLFGVRGSLRIASTTEPTLYLWPRRGGHSSKPDAFYDLVERLSPAPRLELFARRNRLGWHTWGNECLNHVELRP